MERGKKAASPQEDPESPFSFKASFGLQETTPRLQIDLLFSPLLPSVCNLTCSMGRVNAECDACMCEEHLLQGKVSLQDGAPAAGAAVYLQGKATKPLTVAGGNGLFQIPGVCPDGRTVLQIKKANYVTALATVPESARKRLRVFLKRAGKELLGVFRQT